MSCKSEMCCLLSHMLMLQCHKVGPHLPTNVQGLLLCSKLSIAASESAVTTTCLPLLSACAVSAHVTKGASSRYDSEVVTALRDSACAGPDWLHVYARHHQVHHPIATFVIR